MMEDSSTVNVGAFLWWGSRASNIEAIARPAECLPDLIYGWYGTRRQITALAIADGNCSVRGRGQGPEECSCKCRPGHS